MYGHQFCPENLKVSITITCQEHFYHLWYQIICAFVFHFHQKLILSETSIFDVLPNFFYHSNQVVCMAALEVYAKSTHGLLSSSLFCNSLLMAWCVSLFFFFSRCTCVELTSLMSSTVSSITSCGTERVLSISSLCCHHRIPTGNSLAFAQTDETPLVLNDDLKNQVVSPKCFSVIKGADRIGWACPLSHLVGGGEVLRQHPANFEWHQCR